MSRWKLALVASALAASVPSGWAQESKDDVRREAKASPPAPEEKPGEVGKASELRRFKAH